ncbi:MAG TPA: TraR/DksA C4-type zinc finger protein [Acidimicrobiia bacterium]|jgi:DnaK suppressor protein|nr:TraR/DksA C4-type zinc finger protein [Acidimicrobiia bacterium]
MTRELAPTTLKRLRSALEEERDRIIALLEEHEQEREEARLSETSAERSPEPASAEAGSMAFEFEKELSIDQNASDLLRKVEHALRRLADKTYGTCEVCGQPIPVARLEALPYATLCVKDASRA